MTSKNTENYLNAQSNASEQPLVAEGFQNLMNLYVNKLWNQLSDEAQRLVRNDEFIRAVNLRQFYEEFIHDFERRVEPFQLIELVTPIAENIFNQNIKQAFEFLDNFDNVVKQDKRASIHLQSSKIHLRLKDKPTSSATKCKDLPLVRAMLEEAKTKLDQLVEVGAVHAAYYKCSAEYQYQMGDYKQYYEEALHYLGCEDIEAKLSTEEQRQQAVNLSIAALLGDGVYNFGELLAHPILNVLNGTPKAWLVDVLNAVNAGAWDGFQKYKGQLIKEFPEAGQKIAGLEQKLRLLCLMEMAHHLPAQRRDIPFSDIARAVRVEEDQVELLAMKAVANGLIEAKIDEPARLVNISWVQPRVLSIQQIKELASRTGNWHGVIGTMKEELELQFKPEKLM